MQPRKEKRPGMGRTMTKGAKYSRLHTKHNEKKEACKCPRCGFIAGQHLIDPKWPDELQMLAARHWSLGSGPGLVAMSLDERYAHLLWLRKQG